MYWINGECLKRHNVHFKNVIIKHSLAELKSDLESGKVRNLPNRMTIHF